MSDSSRRALAEVRRVVVKLGSQVVMGEGHVPDPALFAWLCEDVAWMRERHVEVVLVTSGAVATGMGRLGHSERPATIPDKQALAAVGQLHLMSAYAEHFSRAGLVVAQVLLTGDDLRARSRYRNAQNTLEALLRHGTVPVINENDTVAVAEIKFGDNDNLSSLVASLVEADCLVILSDVEGLYDRDPKEDPNARLLRRVDGVDEAVAAFAGGTRSKVGTGGMATKLTAAKRAVHGGMSAVIASGRTPHALRRLFEGEEIGTFFTPAVNALHKRKHWIAYTAQAKGALRIDRGAVRAILERGTSLLPKGVTEVTGGFERGDAVEILSPDGEVVARGLTRYGAEEVRVIAGLASREIADRLGRKGADEVVHRDDLVVMR
jgi:glutamate 5-kinase